MSGPTPSWLSGKPPDSPHDPLPLGCAPAADIIQLCPRLQDLIDDHGIPFGMILIALHAQRRLRFYAVTQFASRIEFYVDPNDLSLLFPTLEIP